MLNIFGLDFETFQPMFGLVEKFPKPKMRTA